MFLTDGVIPYCALRDREQVVTRIMKLPGSKKKKTTTSCPRCNAPMPAGTPFCDACGARIAPPPSCSLCGTLLEPGSRFCPSCGAMIGNSKDTPANAESAGKPAPAEKKPRAGRAKKPNKGEADGNENVQEIPMRGSERDKQDLPGESGASAADTPEPVKKPEPPAARTTINPEGRRPLIRALPDWRFFAASALLLVLLGLATLAYFGHFTLPGIGISAGTSSPVTPVATPSAGSGTMPTVTAVVTSTAGTVTLVPGPTRLPPENFLVYFQAERDPRNHLVTVQYMGGKGQYGVAEVFVRLTRSDGQVLTGSFKPVQVGSGVELQGTEKTDRLEVIVRYSTGDEYVYIDKLFEYKIRN